MRHWCFYTRVVTYLEKVEALFPDKKRKGAYLLWRDDDGNPLMIAGPGVDWFQGRGPMPDLNNLGQAVTRKPTNRNIRGVDGSPRSRRHECRRTSAEAPRHQASANSNCPNASEQESRESKQESRPTNQQSRGRKPAVKTPTHRPSATSKTAQAAQQPRSPTKQANTKRTKFVKSAQFRSNPLNSRHEKQNPAALLAASCP